MSDSFDYQHMQEVADRLIAKFGQDVIVRKNIHSGPTYDPIITHQDYKTKGAVVNLPRWYSAFAGTTSDVLTFDRIAYVSMGPLIKQGLTELFANDNYIFANGLKDFQVINAKPIYPGGLTVVYVLEIKL